MEIGNIDIVRSIRKYYNASPNTALPVLVKRPRLTLEYMRWGLIPSAWKTSTPPNNLYYAPTNRIIQHRFFKLPIRHQRCVIPVSYYITWKDDQPYLCFIEETYIFGIAGVFDCWQAHKDASPVYSFCPLMTPANQRMSALGNEMPMILWPSQYRTWLGEHTSLSSITHSLDPYRGKINAYPISKNADDPTYNEKDIYRPIGKRLHRKYRDVPVVYTEDRKGRKTVTEWRREYLD